MFAFASFNLVFFSLKKVIWVQSSGYKTQESNIYPEEEGRGGRMSRDVWFLEEENILNKDQMCFILLARQQIICIYKMYKTYFLKNEVPVANTIKSTSNL